MTEELIVRAVIADLRIGVIQEWQIESALESRSVSSFNIDRLKKEIMEKFAKEKQFQKRQY